MFGLGAAEISLIVGIIVLIMAVRRIPTLKEAVSKSLQNFKRAASGEDEIDVTPKRECDGARKRVRSSEDESSSRP